MRFILKSDLLKLFYDSNLKEKRFQELSTPENR